MLSFTKNPSETSPSHIAIRNVRIFDGESEKLREDMNISL